MAIETITGETPDITAYLYLNFYELVTFKLNSGLVPSEIGWWLGESHIIGPLMSYCTL